MKTNVFQIFPSNMQTKCLNVQEINPGLLTWYLFMNKSFQMGNNKDMKFTNAYKYPIESE